MNDGSRSLFALETLEKRTLLSFQTFTPPTPSRDLRGETLGTDGSLYFAEVDNQKIGRILPNKRVAEYAVPDSGFGVIGTLLAARDGSIFFTSRNASVIGRLTTRGRLTAISTNGQVLAIGAATDGSIWFYTLSDGFSRITTRGVMTNFGDGNPSRYVAKIIAGPSGSIYYSAVSKTSDPTNTTPYLFSIHQVTFVDGQPQDDTLFSGNTNFTFDNVAPYLLIPFSANNLAVGSDGNLWFYDGYATVWAEDPNTGELVGSINQSAFSHPNPASPNDLFPTPLSDFRSLISGPDGKLWFVDHQEGRIWTFSVDGEISSYSLANNVGGSQTDPFTIVAGRRNTLWITDQVGGRIFYLDLTRTAVSNLATLNLSIGFNNNSVDGTAFTVQAAPSASGPWTDGSTQKADSGFVVAQSVYDLFGVFHYVRVFSDGYYSRVVKYQ